jgi:hypothetical protein
MALVLAAGRLAEAAAAEFFRWPTLKFEARREVRLRGEISQRSGVAIPLGSSLNIPSNRFLTPSILSAAADLRGGPCPDKGLASQSWRGYKGRKMLTLIRAIAGTPRTGVSLERHEPFEGKLSRTVLRGVWAD